MTVLHISTEDELEAVGESFYAAAIAAVAKRVGPLAGRGRFRVLLVPEPENPYDSNAVAVVDPEAGKLGHLSRDDAPEYQELLIRLKERHGIDVSCDAMLVGFGSGRNRGVILFVSLPRIAEAAAKARDLGQR